MGYQFFLPMVLRWRALHAEAPLLICIFSPRAECRTFSAQIGQLRGKKKIIARLPEAKIRKLRISAT